MSAPAELDRSGQVRAPRPSLRLTVMWFLTSATISVVWGAIPSVLVAVQLQRIAPDDKVQNLALVTGLAALMSILVQPIAGRLSDSTRTRLGGRSPWMLGGALVGGAGIVAMAYADGVAAIVLLYLVVVIGMNSAGLPFGTVLAERVDPRYRGGFSALGAIGGFGGIVAGQAIAAALIDDTRTAYLVVAAIAIIGLLAFVVLNPERSNRGEPAAPLSWRRMLGAFWFHPRRNPDFAWVLVGRLLLGLAGYLIVSYNLYILQGYIHLTTAEAAAAIPLLSLVSGVGLVASTLTAGPLSDRLGRRKVFLYVAGGLFVVGLMVPFLVPSLTGMIVSQALTGLALGCMGSVDQALLTQVLPDADDVGKDLGIGFIAINAPQALAPFVAGTIISLAGFGPLFPIAAVIALLGTISVVFIRSVR